MNLNLRDFPEELWKELKSEAALTGMTLKEVVVDKCLQKKKSGEEKISTPKSGVTKTEKSVPPTSSVDTVTTITEEVESEPPKYKSFMDKPKSEMTPREMREYIRRGGR